MSYLFRYRKHAEALYLALTEDHFYITLEKSVGDDESGREAMLKYMDYSMIEAESFGELLLVSGCNGGSASPSNP